MINWQVAARRGYLQADLSRVPQRRPVLILGQLARPQTHVPRPHVSAGRHERGKFPIFGQLLPAVKLRRSKGHIWPPYSTSFMALSQQQILELGEKIKCQTLLL